MLINRIGIAVLLMVVASSSSAAEWIDFISLRDGFAVTLPVQPKVKASTFRSEYGALLRARVYSTQIGELQYDITVVDYGNIQQVLREKSYTCTLGDARCSGSAFSGEGHWRFDLAGAVVYASWGLIQGDARVIRYEASWIDNEQGLHLQFVDKSNQTHTSAWVYMHSARLYVLEATGRPTVEESSWFGESLRFLDK